VAVGAGQAAWVAQALHPPWRLEPAALVMKSPIDSTVPDCISPKAQRWLSGRSFEETTKNGSQLGARFGTIACEPGWVPSLRVRFVGCAVGSEFSFPLELGRRAARRLLPRGRGGLAQAALATSVLLPQLLVDAAWVLLLKTVARAVAELATRGAVVPVVLPVSLSLPQLALLFGVLLLRTARAIIAEKVVDLCGEASC
jgi:hypothetical protein